MKPAVLQPIRPILSTEEAGQDDSVTGGDVGEQSEIAVEGPEYSTEEEEVEPQKTVKTPYTPSA